MMTPTLLSITLLKHKAQLKLQFEHENEVCLDASYLRAYSPSAETRKQNSEQLLQQKQTVKLLHIEPIGHYAVRLIFNDGHRTGIYSFDTLYHLACQYREEQG